MTRQEYKEKLRSFNATDKYQAELEILRTLLLVRSSKFHIRSALDFGCGLGTAMSFLRRKLDVEIYGYDLDELLYEDDPFYFRKEFFFSVDAAYFMHSFAHIENPEDQILKLKDEGYLNPKSRIIIITPNREWLYLKGQENYSEDPTVFCHYNLVELNDMLQRCGYQNVFSGQFGEPIESGGKTINERIFIVGER